MAGIVNSPLLTLEEFLQLPETQPASEFVDGRIEQKPTPQGKHARLQLKFCDAVNEVAEAAQIAMALPELRLHIWRSVHRNRCSSFYLAAHSV